MEIPIKKVMYQQKIKAVQLAQLKAKRDTNIIGSTVSGKKVDVDTGRDLHIQSLQDVDNFKEHSKSAGFSVSSKPTFKDFVGSIGGSVGRIDSKWKSVTKQAGIQAGDEGYIINTGNKTKLKGAVISSKAERIKIYYLQKILLWRILPMRLNIQFGKMEYNIIDLAILNQKVNMI